MEDGLVPFINEIDGEEMTCLNPCCNGRWSRTQK